MKLQDEQEYYVGKSLVIFPTQLEDGVMLTILNTRS